MSEVEAAAYSIEEFCRVYGVGRTKLYEELAAGRLQARKCGSRTLIPAAAAQAWLAGLPEFQPSSPEPAAA